MPIPKEYVAYAALSSRQKENHNYHKVASVLADYGYASIRLSDDWNGADFLAIHVTGRVVRVQLKSGIVLNRKYMDKDLYIAFPDPKGNGIYLFPHDEYIEKFVGMETRSWLESGRWEISRPGKKHLDILKDHHWPSPR